MQVFRHGDGDRLMRKQELLFISLPCLQDAGLPARARADKDHTMSLQMCTDSSERDGAFASL